MNQAMKVLRLVNYFCPVCQGNLTQQNEWWALPGLTSLGGGQQLARLDP